MDFGLAAEQKTEMLTSMRNSIKVDIYGSLVRLGVDPDSFEGEDDLPDPMSVPAMLPEIDRVKHQLAALALIESKLA